jgi:hypothetical protein
MKRPCDPAVACLALAVSSLLVTDQSTAGAARGTVSIKRVDLCTIASADTLQALFQNGIQQLFPIPMSSGDESLEISSPSIEQVSCPHMSIKVHAQVQYRHSRGPTQWQTGGSLILGSPIVADLQFSSVHDSTTVSATNLNQALALATNPLIIALKIDNVPNWLDPAWIRACLNGQHAEWGCRDVMQRMRFDVTQLVQFYLQQGLTL